MNALFTFDAVARQGSFAAASSELNVTPAAVSRMIARLEEHLGQPLFLRHPGGVTPTHAGQVLADATTRGLTTIESALRELAERQRGVDTVTLSVSTGFTTHWLMPRMARFKVHFPTVELRFQLIMGAISGPVSDVDFGMRYVAGHDARPDARLETSLIMPELLLPVCSPHYPRPQDTALPPVSQMEPTGFSDQETGWSQLFFPGAGANGAAGSSMVFSDYAIVIQAALLGQGVALGWLNVVSHWLCSGALIPARRQIIRTGRLCHFVNQRGKQVSPVALAVRDWLTQELRAEVRQVGAKYPDLDLGALWPPQT